MHPLVRHARDFAIAAHRGIGHQRKFTGEPYETHLEAVADLVAEVTDDPATIAAAWLHDVVEDTPVTLGQVRAEFGDDVARLVDDLTDVSRPHHGRRAVRKEIDRRHSADADPRAKTVKLANVLHNARDLLESNPSFARVYFREATLLLEVLGDGDRRLYDAVQATLASGVPRRTSLPAGVGSALAGSPMRALGRGNGKGAKA